MDCLIQVVSITGLTVAIFFPSTLLNLSGMGQEMSIITFNIIENFTLMAG